MASVDYKRTYQGTFCVSRRGKHGAGDSCRSNYKESTVHFQICKDKWWKTGNKINMKEKEVVYTPAQCIPEADMGVNGIISDYPARVQNVLAQYAGV